MLNEPKNLEGAAIQGWADTQRLDDGSEQIRILVLLNGIPDADRPLAIGEALSVAQSILADSGQTTATTH